MRLSRRLGPEEGLRSSSKDPVSAARMSSNSGSGPISRSDDVALNHEGDEADYRGRRARDADVRVVQTALKRLVTSIMSLAPEFTLVGPGTAPSAAPRVAGGISR